MKKKKFIIILGILFITLGGVQLKKELDKKQLLKTEGPRIEKYLKYNYKNITTVHFTDVIINPTGIPHIKGYINNDKELKFNAGIYDKHYEASLSWFNDNTAPKRYNDLKNKTVTEIEKEEAQKKN